MFSAQPPKGQGGKAPGCWKRHPLSFNSAGGQELLRLAVLCQDASRHRGNPGKHQSGASHKAKSRALAALALALTFPARKTDAKHYATFPGPKRGSVDWKDARDLPHLASEGPKTCPETRTLNQKVMKGVRGMNKD